MVPRSLLFLAMLGAFAPAAGQEIPLLPPPRPLPSSSAPEPRLPAPADSPPSIPLDAPMVEKDFCAIRVHPVERQDLKLVPRVVPLEVISRVPTMDVEVTYKEERRRVPVLVLKAREIERPVTTMTLVPETTVDCTGCPHTKYKPVPVCKLVKVQVFEQVSEMREYVVRVPVLRPVEKEILVRRFVLDQTPQPAVFRKFDLLVLPIKAKVPVPTCPAPAAACEAP